MAALLVMNRNDDQRKQMTTSGLNAPLTNEGFLTVARWNSIAQMEAFIFRVMMHENCQVLSERMLHDFVATGFRDLLDPRKGFEEDETSLTLRDVVRVLKGMDWVKTGGQDVDDEVMKQGTRVRIHERRRATVQRVLPPDSTTQKTRYVAYYDELNGDEAEDHEILDDEQLHARTLMPKIPKYMLSSKIKEGVRKFAWQVDYGKKSAILPALQVVSDVLTWQKPVFAWLILAVLLIKVALNLIAFFLPAYALMAWISSNTGHFVLVGVLILSFLVFAQPLAWIMPWVSMRSDWVRRKRTAPDTWPFFKQEDDLVLDVGEASLSPKDITKETSRWSSPRTKSPKASPTPQADQAEDSAGTAPLLEPPQAGSKPCCVIC
jgi:hypothetical protein